MNAETWPGRVIRPRPIRGFSYATLHHWPTYVSVGVHNLVYQAFVGPIPPGHFVSHKDGDKSNNRAGNLMLVPVSERRFSTKLNAKKVIEIRRRAEKGHRRENIAGSFGVCRATIRAVVERETWRHVG